MATKDVTVKIRVEGFQHELWVEAAGGERKLSAWLRDAATAALTERGVVAAAPADRDIAYLAAERTVTAAPRSASARVTEHTFRGPDPKGGGKK